MNTTPQAPTIIRSLDDFAPIPLEAPDIAIAFHDEDNPGLIPVAALTAPLILEFTVWEAARPGFTYQLFWDGEKTGLPKSILETDRPGDVITLEIPLELLTEGSHSAAYRTYNPNTEYENFSDAFYLVIDTTAPGKPDLAPIHFPVEVQNGLTAAELAQLGDNVKAEVAGYTGMAKHDAIQCYWGDTLGPAVIVDEDDMGLNKVLIDFSGEFLRSIPEGPQTVKYRVTDRAGNVSDDSITTDILLLLAQVPDDYPAPIVDESVGELIEYSEAKLGVRVDIPQYPGATAFDQITLYWGADQPMLPVQLPPGNEGEDIVLSVRVPYETIAIQPIGTVSVSYAVARQNQVVGSSQKDDIDVYLTLPIKDSLKAPTIQGTSVENPNKTDNFIDEDDYELNARAVIEWNPAFQVNDDLNLFWGDQKKPQWYQIKEEDVTAARNLILPIANSIVRTQGTGADIPVYYTLIRAGNPNVSCSLLQHVTVRSKEELPGGPDGIDGPVFKLTSAGYISLVVAPNGTDGFVKPFVNIAENQKLFFSFKGFDEANNPIDAATFTATRELDDIDVINGYSFAVPFNILRTVCAGFCEAYVRVEPASGSNQSAVTSRTTRVPVDMRETIETYCTINPL